MKGIMIIALFMALMPRALDDALLYNESAEAIAKDIALVSDDLVEYMDEYADVVLDIEGNKALNAFYHETIEDLDGYLEELEALGDRLDAIKEDISEADYDDYMGSVETIIDGIEDIQDVIESSILEE